MVLPTNGRFSKQITSAQVPVISKSFRRARVLDLGGWAVRLTLQGVVPPIHKAIAPPGIPNVPGRSLGKVPCHVACHFPHVPNVRRRVRSVLFQKPDDAPPRSMANRFRMPRVLKPHALRLVGFKESSDFRRSHIDRIPKAPPCFGRIVPAFLPVAVHQAHKSDTTRATRKDATLARR